MQKSCHLDPPPAMLLKEHFDLLLPSICRVVNLLLVSGLLLSSLKNAVLTPLLKKRNLDHELFNNFRITSRLSGKLLRRLRQCVFKFILTVTHSQSRYNQPTNHSIAVKLLLSVFKMTFCLLLIIATVSCSCY